MVQTGTLSEVKEGSIDIYNKCNWDCPRQTRTSGHPSFWSDQVPKYYNLLGLHSGLVSVKVRNNCFRRSKNYKSGITGLPGPFSLALLFSREVVLFLAPR